MKKLGDMGANPTIQLDVVDLDEVKLEAEARLRAESLPPTSRVGPPPLPPSAFVAQDAGALPSAPRRSRSNVVVVLALVACLAVGFGVVALLRTRGTETPAPPAAVSTSPSVITIPTIDMNDDAPGAR